MATYEFSQGYPIGDAVRAALDDSAYQRALTAYRFCFWSLTIYDAQTRSQVQTDQDKAAVRSLFELKGLGDEAGTVDLFVGPDAPDGAEEGWIKTTPGRGWFTYIRIYGPEAPAFDGRWTLPDFEPLD